MGDTIIHYENIPLFVSVPDGHLSRCQVLAPGSQKLWASLKSFTGGTAESQDIDNPTL